MFDSLHVLIAPASTELRDELECYLSTDPEHITDVIEWWYERRFVYPRLSRMALNYLMIPSKYSIILSHQSSRQLLTFFCSYVY
jgi:hypothetical protein